MKPVPVRRLADHTLNAVAPRVAVRSATDAFSRTREAAAARDDLLPLHARAFAVPGQVRIERGYLWGSDPAEPVAVLLHGWRADSGSMFSLIAPVQAQGFAVAAFDAPGHGRSRGKVATITEYVAAAAAVLTALGGVRVLIAHSLGAIAAVAALASSGLSVAKLVLIAPTCTLTGVLERWRPPDIKLTPKRLSGIYSELHRRNGTPVSYWDVRSLGRGLTCPVLAIHDPEDPVVPFRESEAIAAALPQTEILPVPGRGHRAILVAPEVKRAVAGFVARPASAA